jgi:eukaryotic-like serine/threonine-protein kinase
MTPGVMLTPHIRLVSPLDQGSMGTVWIAEHLALGARVAVKLMSQSTADSPTLVVRFAREADAAARIESPHVVRILEHGIAADNAPYIAMELLEGESLKAYLARRGRLDPPELSSILRGACAGIGAAHRLGIVHRDIKPANVFLAREAERTIVKILDFGIAKLYFAGADMTRTADRMGTPLYMSPEQLFSAKHVDARADIWSVGVVAYCALTGVLPYQAGSLAELVVAIQKGPFARPSSRRPDLPPRLDTWFLRALAREPGRRFASAEEAAAEFERAGA